MVNSTDFPELGYVAAGSTLAKTSGASQGLGTLIALTQAGRLTGISFSNGYRKLQMNSTTSSELPSVYLARHGETA